MRANRAGTTLMLDRLIRVGRLALGYIPSRTPRSVARRLILRANAAREMRQWLVASALYEEALHVTPTARIHKQCGHMFKEAGQFEAAEHQYRAAERMDPLDADLALQIGHFELVRGDPAAAAIAYGRALVLKAGWDEPARALERLPAGAAQSRGRHAEAPIVELLPRDEAPFAASRETIQVRRLGSLRQHANGYGRVLQGVEAIRGFCVSATPLTEIVVTLGGAEVARGPLVPQAAPGGHHKHVFNLWIDVSHEALGRAVVELRFLEARRLARVHRAAIDVLAPLREVDHLGSDTVVDPAEGSGEALVRAINARPSIVHPSIRSPLAPPVETIVVQRIDQLGDLAVSIPALQRLRAIFRNAHISLVVATANVEFAAGLGLADRIVPVDVLTQAEGRRAISREAQAALLERLRDRSYDLAIDLSEGAESRPLLRLAGARFTYGFRAATAPWLSASFDLAAPDPLNGLETCSPARKLLAMVASLEQMHRPLPPLRPPEPNLSVLQRFGLGARPYVVLHTGARLEMNRWPHFGTLAQLLLERTPFDILLFEADADSDMPTESRLHRVQGLLPFGDFDALIAAATVFVGNDSGPKHLAAARGVATISLHLARLNWAEWGQEGRGSIISRRVPCAGCGIDRDPGECGMDFACLRHIQPEEVLAEILRQANPASGQRQPPQASPALPSLGTA